MMQTQVKCMFPRRVNADMIMALPLKKCPLEIALVQTEEELDIALQEISAETILGFDTETRPNFSRHQHYKVSILQLGGANKIWVIRLIPLQNRLADIYKVLENPNIVKAGLAVQGDIRALSQRCAFKAENFIDVAKFTTKIGIINTGMKNLAAVFLGERISKSSQMSNWEAETLTQKQIDYAATDAWMSRRLYLEVLDVIEKDNYVLEPEPEPEPEPIFERMFKQFCSDVKEVFKSAKKKIKTLLHKPQPKKKKRRRKRKAKKPDNIA